MVPQESVLTHFRKVLSFSLHIYIPFSHYTLLGHMHAAKSTEDIGVTERMNLAHVVVSTW